MTNSAKAISFPWIAVLLSAQTAFCADSIDLPTGRYYVQQRPDGVIELMDSESFKYRQNSKDSKLPLPSQKQLDEALKNTVELKIYKSGMENGKPLRSEVLFTSRDPAVITELKTQLTIMEDPRFFGHDPCLGGPTLSLLDSDKNETFIGVHHGVAIRWSAWRSDVALKNPQKFIAWLASKGATGPLEEKEFDEKQAKVRSPEARQERFNQFVKAMPKSLREYFKLTDSGNGLDKAAPIMVGLVNYSPVDPKTQQGQDAIKALSKEFSTTQEQVGALLEWSGTQADIIDAFQFLPIYLLTQMDPEEILRVTTGTNMTTNRYIGASRLYSYMGFRDLFPDGYSKLDKNLSSKIIEKLESTGRNQADLEEFKEALAHWQYPVRLERIREMIEESKKSPQSKPHF